MFNLQDSNGNQIEASLAVYNAPGGHTVRLRFLGEELPNIIQTAEDGTTHEIDGGRRCLLMIGGGNPLDTAEQEFETAIVNALNSLITAKGI